MDSLSVYNLSDNSHSSLKEISPCFFGSVGRWEYHMRPLSTVPLILATEAQCLEEASFVEVAGDPPAGL